MRHSNKPNKIKKEVNDIKGMVFSNKRSTKPLAGLSPSTFNKPNQKKTMNKPNRATGSAR
jgi:hypothetical protein